jgi:hypothetical protein
MKSVTGRYASGDKWRLIIFNYLHSPVSTREWLKYVRRNSDTATAHYLSYPNLTSS